MGFTGVAVTDSLGMGAVNSRYDFQAAAVRAIEAGADLAFATDGRQAGRMRDALVAAVDRGELPATRLDEAATRVGRLTGADVAVLTCAQA
jgi:beta-N-acetylhexosaminidase